MPESRTFTVIITARYGQTAESPKNAIGQALARSDHPDTLTVEATDDDA